MIWVRGVPEVTDTLRKANSHFDPTQIWSGPHNNVEPVVDRCSEYLDEIIEIQQNKIQQQLFRATFSTFWCGQIAAHSLLAKKALEILVPLVIRYLCEQSLSKMVDI